ncbi:MAG: hypothetical protein HY925_12775, partial [Elusimicrobia bacterium]|nr:hypothetical protein [Elusimicrobiota bacterium]
FDPKAAQTQILRSKVFQDALERQFFFQYPQYANLRGKPLSAWPADALHAREHAIGDLYFSLTSRHFKEAEYFEMLEADVKAGKLPAGFKSYLQAAAATPHGECSPSGPCAFKQPLPPNSPEYICMDIGNTGRFRLQPKDEQPPCEDRNVGQVAVFPTSCGWDAAVCLNAKGAKWKYLHEVKGFLGDDSPVYSRVKTELKWQGFELDRDPQDPHRGRTPDGVPTGTKGPKLAVNAPKDGATISGETDFQTFVGDDDAPMQRLELRVNGRLIGGSALPARGNLNSSTRIDTTLLKDGEYEFTFSAVDQNFSTSNRTLRVTVANGNKSRATEDSSEAIFKKLAQLKDDSQLLSSLETAKAGGPCDEHGDCMTAAPGGGNLVCAHDGAEGWRWLKDDAPPTCSPDPGSACRIVEFAAVCPDPWGPARCYPGSDSRQPGDNRVGHWRFLTENPPSPDPCAGH